MTSPGQLLHERAYRSDQLMQKIRQARIIVCGAGAVGSNVAMGLARQGFGTLAVIDDDRVTEQNLSTQEYRRGDIGALKVVALRNEIFRAVGVEVETEPHRLVAANVDKLLARAAVIVDGFDNAQSRSLVCAYARRTNTPCLHVGLAADFAEVTWEPHYQLPTGSGQDICDYPLARNLVQLACAVAGELLVDFLDGNPPSSYTITLRDLMVLRRDAPEST